MEKFYYQKYGLPSISMEIFLKVWYMSMLIFRIKVHLNANFLYMWMNTDTKSI